MGDVTDPVVMPPGGLSSCRCRENSVEQPAFQAGVNFRVRPAALERHPFRL